MTSKHANIFERIWHRGGSPDGSVSRLHRVASPLFLLIIAVIQSLGLLGRPIRCWAPAQFTGNYIDYTEAHCWKEGKHYVPNDTSDATEQIGMISKPIIYSWIPLGLLLMAFLFLLPWLIWQELTSLVRINLPSLVISGQKLQDTTTGAEREKIAGLLASQIYRHVSPMCSIYLSFCQVLLKLLCLASVVMQFFCLNWLLGISFKSFGVNWIERAFASGTIFEDSEYFPDKTLCDMQIRGIRGRHNNFRFQCEFTIRPLMDKTLLIVWTYFVILTAITTWSFLRDVITMVFPTSYYNFVQQLLPNRGHETEGFTGSCLKADGVYLLRVLEREAGGIAAAEVAEALFQLYTRSISEVPRIYAHNPEQVNHASFNPSSGVKASAPALYHPGDLQASAPLISHGRVIAPI